MDHQGRRRDAEQQNPSQGNPRRPLEFGIDQRCEIGWPEGAVDRQNDRRDRETRHRVARRAAGRADRLQQPREDHQQNDDSGAGVPLPSAPGDGVRFFDGDAEQRFVRPAEIEDPRATCLVRAGDPDPFTRDARGMGREVVDSRREGRGKIGVHQRGDHGRAATIPCLPGKVQVGKERRARMGVSRVPAAHIVGNAPVVAPFPHDEPPVPVEQRRRGHPEPADHRSQRVAQRHIVQPKGGEPVHGIVSRRCQGVELVGHALPDGLAAVLPVSGPVKGQAPVSPPPHGIR